jgi:hypothetical protein
LTSIDLIEFFVPPRRPDIARLGCAAIGAGEFSGICQKAQAAPFQTRLAVWLGCLAAGGSR